MRCRVCAWSLAVAAAAAAAAASSSAAAASPPTVVAYPMTNLAYPVGEGSGGGASPYVAPLGRAPSLAACTALAAAWRNASAPVPAQSRCASATWLRAPANASQAGACLCRADARWLPYPSAGADSARLLWPCAGAADCSHNGACAADGSCVCRPAWTGARCGELALQPVDAAAPGLRLRNASGHNVSTWGAAMLRDGATGVWHAWASQLAGGCGLNSWTSNSRIVHATAASPGGPWSLRAVVARVFAHEPDVVRGPAGEWVLAYSTWPLPRGAPRCTDCAGGETLNHSAHTGCGANASHAFRTVLAVAPAPGGPWAPPVELRPLDAPWDWDLALTILPNRSAVAVLRALFTWHAADYANASSWAPVGGAPEGPPLADANVEDPYIWREGDGVFHAIVHAMDADARFCGGHAWSEDGRSWTYTGFAWGNAANYTDGSWQVFSRRERPHLLFDGDGAGAAPIALSTGVQYGERDAVFTLVQPLRAAAEAPAPAAAAR